MIHVQTPEYQELVEKEDKFEQDIKDILEFLKSSDMNPEALDLDTLRNWKAMFGKVYASRVTDDAMVYIWRPLLRLEYKQMIGTSSEAGSVKWEDDFLRQDAILKKCLLYPKPDYETLRDMRAGIPKTLEEQILYQSGFISMELAASKIHVLG